MAFTQDDFGTTAQPEATAGPSSITGRIPCLTIMSHPDPGRIGERAYLAELFEGREQPLARAAPDFAVPGRIIGKPLHDPFISRTPLILSRTTGDDLVVSRGTCQTLVSVDAEPLASVHRIEGKRLDRGVVLVLAERVVLLLHHASIPSKSTKSSHGMIGASASLHALRREIDRVADLKTPILLRGASGTGKELAARAIHEAGPHNRPFVAVNLGAIAPNLAASELFGAVKGAFTGADRHQLGFFRAAQGGTLFLDEIGEASAEVQVMLLRALESGEVVPVGAQRPFKVETRLIAATDADLESMMEADSFKTPLFHRLSSYEIRLPSLTDRLDDVGRLFLNFAREQLALQGDLSRLRFSDPYAKPWIPAPLMADLLHYDWPGNIRQLRNVAIQLVVENREATGLKMTPKVARLLGRSTAHPEPRKQRHRKPAEIGDDELKDALRANGWEIKAAAEALGISRGTLYQRIRNAPNLHLIDDHADEAIEAALRDHGGDFSAAAESLAVSERALRKRVHQREA